MIFCKFGNANIIACEFKTINFTETFSDCSQDFTIVFRANWKKDRCLECRYCGSRDGLHI